MTEEAEPNEFELLFLEAEALGVSVVGNDIEELLAAIHDHESDLIFLRHEIQRRMAGIAAQPDPTPTPSSEPV